MKYLLPIFILFSLISCRLEEEKGQDIGTLHIVATTGIIGDAVAEIVGDSAEVSSIMGPGTDPHIYKPTPGDIDMLDDADVIIVNGLHLEGKMSDMLEKYSKEKPVLLVSDGIEKRKLIKSADMDDSYDPHIWFDTKIWIDGMMYITAELSKLDTASREYFETNCDSYHAQVAIAQRECQDLLDSIPQDQRTLITSHDAFSYFGRAYGIEVKGIQGISTVSEVGLRDISEMVDYVVENKIRSIFVETSTSDKTAQSIVDGAADKGHTVRLEGPLYSDALGEPHSAGGTYLGMLKENARMISQGLR